MITFPPLLHTRRFLPLFLTQFLGAFNDNVFKNALAMLLVFKSPAAGSAPMLATLAAGLFISPYLFFSATAGQLADKYDLGLLARRVKLAEILIMAAAAVGFYAHSIYFLMFVLFSLGAQATFFGPIKYALLPRHLREEELIAGNAWIEAGTFLAILIGTIAGGLLILSENGEALLISAMMTCALAGYAASRYIPPGGSAEPGLKINWNFAQETWRIMQSDRKNPRVFAGILGISWFWLIGATFLSQFPAYARDTLHAGEAVVTLFLAVFSLGVGVGSFMCGPLLKGRISTAYTAPAAFGISIFTLDLYVASLMPPGGIPIVNMWQFLSYAANWRILADLLGISLCAGVYIVPLYAVLQHDSDPRCRARTIASNNIVNALFMVAAAAGTALMLRADFTIPQVFLMLGAVNGALAIGLMLRRR